MRGRWVISNPVTCVVLLAYANNLTNSSLLCTVEFQAHLNHIHPLWGLLNQLYSIYYSCTLSETIEKKCVWSYLKNSSLVHENSPYFILGWNFKWGHTKLIWCFTDYLPSQDDPAGQKNIKVGVHHETICITKITMIAKYLEDATSVHNQLANSTFLSITLSCLCSWQQQLLNFYKYLATHTMNYLPLQLCLHHMTVIM